MHWHKRELWKVGIVLAGLPFLLVFLVWVSVGAANAQARASGLTMPGMVMVQATPTEDATVTALNKEKLAQEVQQLKDQNEPDLLGWLQTNASILLPTLTVVIGGLFGLWRWRVDRKEAQDKESKDRKEAQDKESKDRKEAQDKELKDRKDERDKRAEERFQIAVTGLGDEKEGAKVGAAIFLRTFLRPGYEQFYTQTFDLAVANLRLPRISSLLEEDPDALHTPPQADPNTPLPLTTLSQALIMVFKESFPLARDYSGSSNKEKKALQSLDATGIQLDHAYLSGADLKQAWMPQAFLREADLSGTDLSGANLSGTNLSGANLKQAWMPQASLRRADLSGTDLSGTNLSGADLSGAALSGTNLSGAALSGTRLYEVKGLKKEQLATWKAEGAIIEEDSTTNSSQAAASPPPTSQSNNAQALAGDHSTTFT